MDTNLCNQHFSMSICLHISKSTR